MQTLVVYCHPDSTSFCATLHATAISALQEAGHDCRSVDLYAQGFDARLTREEWQACVRPGAPAAAAEPSALDEHVQALRWAQHLVFVFPVWMSGPPALLKGWLDRVWRPGVAFLRPQRPGGLPRPALTHMRRITVVTTSNAPRWWTWLLGDPNRRLFTRALRACCGGGCRVRWLQAHSLAVSTAEQRSAFVDRVRQCVPAA
jgi:NAD(P)H dehydrogenase (quinone)